MTAEPKAERPSRPFRFRWIGVTFVALLAIGLALAMVVHNRYVAYRPVAGRHVPRDATFAARFDLTHVMLYEPFRRFVFPLAEIGGNGRRSRLAARGIEVGGDVREVVVALGRDRSQWSIAIGGPLTERPAAAALSSVLRAEGHGVEERGGVFVVEPGEVAFAQAPDGAFVLARDESRVRAPLLGSDEMAPLGQGAGGVRVTRQWLSAPLESVEASYRAGSVILVMLSASAASGTAAAETSAALKALLESIARLDPELAQTLAHVAIRSEIGRVSADVSLPSSAVERLTERLVEELGGGAKRPGAAALAPH